MSQSASSASASAFISYGRPGAGYNGPEQASPFSYNALAYEPEVKCDCGMKSGMWISWTDLQPGRRFLRYWRAMVRLSLIKSMLFEWFVIFVILIDESTDSPRLWLLFLGG